MPRLRAFFSNQARHLADSGIRAQGNDPQRCLVPPSLTGSLPEITEEKTVVMARDPDAFCELVRILDNGLQPARIQGIRDALRDKTGRQSLRYETAGQGILWFFDANGSLAVKDPG